jgi:hypothetical protein
METKDRAALSRQYALIAFSFGYLSLNRAHYLAMSRNSKRAYFTWSNSSRNTHPTSKSFHQRDQVFPQNLPTPPQVWSGPLSRHPPRSRWTSRKKNWTICSSCMTMTTNMHPSPSTLARWPWTRKVISGKQTGGSPVTCARINIHRPTCAGGSEAPQQ